MWKAYETPEQDNVYSIKRLFSKLKQKSNKPDFSCLDVTKHAARKHNVFKLNSKILTTELQNCLRMLK